MLSDFSESLDALGWLSPVTVQLKHMMPKTCETSAKWDDLLLDHLVNIYLWWQSEVLEEQKKNKNIIFHASATLDQAALNLSKNNSFSKL